MTEVATTPTQDFLPINGTDFVEFYVGNARQAAYYYQAAFGFQPIAYAGPETGQRDWASYVLGQGKIRLVLSTPLRPGGPMNEHLNAHGDGVKVIALWVDDARAAYTETIRRGAKTYLEPTELQDEHGIAVLSGIYTYGETLHRPLSAGLSGVEARLRDPDRGFAAHRPLRRECRVERNEHLGTVLRIRHGL
jgi:4-hydroxyphenylpyruvate dioxygenase